MERILGRGSAKSFVGAREAPASCGEEFDITASHNYSYEHSQISQPAKFITPGSLSNAFALIRMLHSTTCAGINEAICQSQNNLSFHSSSPPPLSLVQRS